MHSESIAGFQSEDNSISGMEPVGIIYGDVGTTEFKCNVTGHIEQTDYVQMRHESVGWVLGQVDTISRKTDLSLEKAQEMAEGREIDIKELVFATINVIGYRDDRGLLQVPRTPFRAGEMVYRASEELIREVIGLKDDPEKGAYIGLLNGHNIKVYLDINTIVQKHMSVLAKTGAGKSYITGVIIEEMMKHGVTLLIIDPHGEYSSMKDPGNTSDPRFGVSPRSYADRIIVFSPDTNINPDARPLRFTLGNMEARDILALTNIKNAKSYMMPLRKAIDYLRAVKPQYGLEDIIAVLEADEEHALGTLINELEYLREMNLFAPQGTRISEIVQPGKTTIINLKGTPPDIQQLIVNRIATALFELRKIGKIPPMMMIVEEAHNYCPQQGQVASSKILRTIASEGRKFGLGMAIISQRPAKIDKNVLSQCNTQLILKVTNPNDIKAVVASVEGLTTGMADLIQHIPLGVAIVTGGGISMPLFVEVRPRETRHGGESVKVI